MDSGSAVRAKLDDMSPRRNEPRHGSVSSDALMHELLVGWERRNPWATAQRLLSEARELLPQDVERKLARATELHAMVCQEERLQDLVHQGLTLERNVFLRKLREIEGFGHRSGWGTDFSERDAALQRKVANIVYEQKHPFVLAGHPKARALQDTDTGLRSGM